MGSTCARERDNVAAVMRACEAITAQDPRYHFDRERILVEGGWSQQLVVARSSRPRVRLSEVRRG